MEYSKIISVTGLPGLFELLSSKTDGAVVRSLEDNSTKFASSRKHNFSHLESIEVFTVRDNVNLVDIFNAMADSKEALPDPKDNKALKGYFEKVYPDMDFDRVYSSDMKKMVKWFQLLSEKGIEIKLSELPEEEPEAEDEEVVEEKPKKTAKKESTEKAKEKEPEEKEEPAPKKAAAKKAAPKKKKD